MTAPRETLCPVAQQAQALATKLMPLLLVSAALVASPRTSRADSVAAEAMALFNEGVRLRDAGKHDEACAMFVESNRLESTAGRLLNVADCHEREGKIATAWAEFLSASNLYKIRNDDDAVAECQRRASLLEPRLSRLTLRVEHPVANLVVRRNGRVVNAAQFGLPLPVDLGEYVVTAEAPGHIPFRTSTSVGLNHSEQMITVPPLARRPIAVPEKGRSVAGYVVSGFGVAALGVGAAFGVMALSSNAKAEDACPSSYSCEHDAAVAAHDRATTQAWVANVGVGLGVAGLAAGGYMLFLMPRSPQVGSGASQYQSVMFSPQPGGLRVGVRFLKRGVSMSALKKSGHSRVQSRLSDNIGIVSLCALTMTMGCQIFGGFDDVPTPSCPPGTVQVGDGTAYEVCAPADNLSGSSGSASNDTAGMSGSMGEQGAAGATSDALCGGAKSWRRDSYLTGTPFAGGDYTCAISRGSTVDEKAKIACWGHNNFGQAASPTNLNTDTPSPTPTLLSGDPCSFSFLPASSIEREFGLILSLGRSHGCGTPRFYDGDLDSRNIFCWGSNSRGQLGINMSSKEITKSSFPLQSYLDPSRVVQMALGAEHSCALMLDGSVLCWGSNEFGQLGSGINFATQEPNEWPTPVIRNDQKQLKSAQAIAAGDNHSCVVTVDHEVWCWGKNDFGQLGRGEAGSADAPEYLAAPVKSSSGDTIIRDSDFVALGGNHSCARTGFIDGDPSKIIFQCWGDNQFGQLGRTTNLNSIAPNPTPKPIEGLTDDVSAVTLGGSHTCAVTGDRYKTAVCWGSNQHGQLGREENFGTTLPNPYPKPLDGELLISDRTITLTLGTSHSCAIIDGSAIECWGSNQFGQLGTSVFDDIIDFNGGADEDRFLSRWEPYPVKNPFLLDFFARDVSLPAALRAGEQAPRPVSR